MLPSGNKCSKHENFVVVECAAQSGTQDGGEKTPLAGTCGAACRHVRRARVGSMSFTSSPDPALFVISYSVHCTEHPLSGGCVSFLSAGGVSASVG